MSGSETQGEYWKEVDEVRRISTCSKCGMMGHFAKDCRRKFKCKGDRRRRKQGIRQRQGQDYERRREERLR